MIMTNYYAHLTTSTHQSEKKQNLNESLFNKAWNSFQSVLMFCSNLKIKFLVDQWMA